MSDERLRLFVALELPDQVREELVHWRRVALEGSVGSQGSQGSEGPEGLDGLREIAPQALHVTLCFLGSQPASELGRIAAACENVGSSAAAHLSLREPIWLPPRRPRVLAVALEDRDRSLAHAQATLSRALQSGGWYKPESRPFLAHVTVARVRARTRVRPAALRLPSPLAFKGSAVTLYRSRPGGQGARYEPLKRITLS